jgi:hypothetical protein
MIIEYTWNELENENLRFTVNGKKLASLAGPEKISGSDLFWSPAFDEGGKPFDLYWKQSGAFDNAEFFTLVSFAPSDIEGADALQTF